MTGLILRIAIWWQMRPWWQRALVAFAALYAAFIAAALLAVILGVR